MNNTYKIYLENTKFIADISRDYAKLANIYKSINLTLSNTRSVSFRDSKLVSIGIFMIAGMPEPIISDIIGLMILSIGSLFIKRKSINDFMIDNFYSITREVKDLYNFLIIDHRI
ncbi:MAG: hypothetical protein QW128_04480 [Thermoprotei archaeon]